MRTILHMAKVTSALFLVPLFSFSCFAGPNWDGTYRYESAQDNTVGGSPVSVKYVLVVSGPDCSLSIDGFQTMERITCRADTEQTSLHVRFNSYKNGKVENEFGVQVYKVDQILFDLDKSGGDISTTWRADKPDSNRPNTGNYFIIK